nr:hypothetical protein [Agilicoccus flavus]
MRRNTTGLGRWLRRTFQATFIAFWMAVATAIDPYVAPATPIATAETSPVRARRWIWGPSTGTCWTAESMMASCSAGWLCRTKPSTDASSRNMGKMENAA